MTTDRNEDWGVDVTPKTLLRYSNNFVVRRVMFGYSSVGDGGTVLIEAISKRTGSDIVAQFSANEWRAIVEAVTEARSTMARGEAYEVTDRAAPDGGPVLRCRRCGFDVAVDRETGSTLAHERAMGASAHPEAF